MRRMRQHRLADEADEEYHCIASTVSMPTYTPFDKKVGGYCIFEAERDRFLLFWNNGRA